MTANKTWAKRRQRILEAAGVTAPPEGLGQLRHGDCGRRGFERARRQHAPIRYGEEGQVRRSPQAVAGRQRDVEARGKPQRLLLGREVEEYCQRESPPQAAGVSYHAESSAVGKAHHMGKDVTGVRRPHRTLLPDTVGSEHQKPTSLRGIANKARVDKQPRFRDLYRCLDADLLLDCWGDLNKDAASGVDDMTAKAYAADLQANSEALAQRLQAQRYRAKLVRRCYSPKGNGTERPLGMPALEDTLGQLAGAKLLMAIYAQDFVDCSDGSRPKRGALEAVRDLTVDLQDGRYGSLVEVDVKGFFDHMAHTWLLAMLRLRIEDRAFLHLIRKWLKAGVLETDGQVIHPETGTPQGGVVSPVLANVYGRLFGRTGTVSLMTP
jgi:Reverse transcriptase (RNA-dependent DNA polymerase)